MKSHLQLEKGNAVVIVLIVLAVISVGALAYLSGKMAGEQTTKVAASDVISEQDVAEASTETQEAAPQIEIQPGNPTIAILNGKEIKRAQIVDYVQGLPIQARQLPLDQLFPAAVNQLINEELARAKAKSSNIATDEEVKNRLEAAKTEIMATVYLQREVEERTTEELLQQAYDAYVASFPQVEEARASHILVEEEKLAKKLIQDLEKGADFSELVAEHSIDTGSIQAGGDIGYFTKADVVPEFAEAAFEQELNKHSFKPVKSQFGFHIITVTDRRQREPASFEEAQQFLEPQIRQAVLQQAFAEWREEAEIELFDINGNPIEPAAGAEDVNAEEEGVTESVE